MDSARYNPEGVQNVLGEARSEAKRLTVQGHMIQVMGAALEQAAPKLTKALVDRIQEDMDSGELERRWNSALKEAQEASVPEAKLHLAALSAVLLEAARYAGKELQKQGGASVAEARYQTGIADALEQLAARIDGVIFKPESPKEEPAQGVA